MYPLAHLAAALVGGRLLQVAVSPRIAPDYRLLALGALLPDLADKLVLYPLGIAQASKHIGHSLIATLAVLLLGVLVPAGRRALVSLGAGMGTHLLLDWPPRFLTVLLWPLRGAFPADPFFHLASIVPFLLERPGLIAGEAAGLLLLAWFVAVHRLWHRQALGALWRTGRLVPVPPATAARPF